MNCPAPQRAAENNNNNADGGGGDARNQMDDPEKDADVNDADATEVTYDACSARKLQEGNKK